MTSAAIQAVEPVIWCVMLNRAMAGPAPLLAATAKASRAPTPPTHMLAASQPTRQLERDVVSASGHGVQEQDRGAADGEHRDGQGPQVERVLADLADDHEDEDCIDHVHVYVHAVHGAAPRPSGASAHRWE